MIAALVLIILEFVSFVKFAYFVRCWFLSSHHYVGRRTAMARVSPSSGTRVGDAHATSRLFAQCFAFRVLNAFAVRTYFNADEFWQGPEVAHRFVFGYGHLTWEWERGLRGYAHVTIFAAVFKLAAWLGVDNTFVIAWGPRVAQAAIAGVGDVLTHQLARRWFQSDTAARYATFCSLACWFNWFCAVRTFSNCLEAVLTTGALVYWPWGTPAVGTASDANVSKEDSGKENARKNFGTANRVVAVALAGASCLVRPTAGLYFFPLFLTELIRTDTKIKFLCLECVPILCGTIGAGVAIDFYFSKKVYVAGWNFFLFNVLEGGSAAYGTHAWHWYLTQGYPAVATVFIPIAFFGCLSGRNTTRTIQSSGSSTLKSASKHASPPVSLRGAFWWEPFLVAAYTIAGHSIAKHKEFRFLMPAVPPTLAAAGGCLAVWHRDPAKKWRAKKAVSLILLTQIPAAAYLGWWHQSGTVPAMGMLANFAQNGEVGTGGIFFATPCHQTPFHSFMHQRSRVPVRMHFLECPPASVAGRTEGAPDEADLFFANPGPFLQSKFPLHDEHNAPSHVVMFDGTSRDPGVAQWLDERGFAMKKNLFHAHFAVDRELQARVLIFARQVVDGRAGETLEEELTEELEEDLEEAEQEVAAPERGVGSGDVSHRAEL